MRTVYAHPSPYTRPGLSCLTTFDGHRLHAVYEVDPLPAAARDSDHPRWSFRVYPMRRLHYLRGKAGLVRSRRRLILSRRRLALSLTFMPPGMLPHVRQHLGGIFLRSDGTHSKTTVLP